MMRLRRGAAPHKLLSVLLRYPDEPVLAARGEIADAVAGLPASPAKRPLTRFAGYLSAGDQTQLAQRYVETFDLNRGSCLYLSYYTHGDTRKRGPALLKLRQTYAAAGFEETTGELPDYLPLMLEFAQLTPDGTGESLLREYRPALEMLRRQLRDQASPYADVLDALCGSLPRLTPLEREHLRRLADRGIPHEDVGLEPYAAHAGMPEPSVPELPFPEAALPEGRP